MPRFRIVQAVMAFLDAMGLGRYKENMPEIDEKTRGKVDLDDVIDIFTELRDKHFVPLRLAALASFNCAFLNPILRRFPL